MPYTIKAGPEVWQQAFALLRGSTRILAMAHVSPDGDAIGSLLGFTHAMRSLGKYVQPVTQDPPHPRFGYLAGLRQIQQKIEGDFDLVVALDSGDLQRLGSPFNPATHGALPMVNIDHHVTNTQFGTVNVIDATVASTSEMVLRLCREMGIPITPEISAALLTGVITDTLAFRTSNTTPETLAAATELMRGGASLMEITRESLVMRSWESIRLMGLGVTNTVVDRGVAYCALTRKLRKEAGVFEDRGDGGLVGTLITAYDVKIAAVLNELANGDVEISFRSSPGYDVSQVAVTLGGGGHPAAAGCTLPGPIRDALNQVLPLLRAAAEKR